MCTSKYRLVTPHLVEHPVRQLAPLQLVLVRAASVSGPPFGELSDEALRELGVDLINLLEDTRVRGVPGLQGGPLRPAAEGAEDLVPAGVPHGPDGVQREAVALAGAGHEEALELLLAAVDPGPPLQPLPDHEEVLVQDLGEVEVEALGAVAHGAAGQGGPDDVHDEARGGGVAEAVARDLRQEPGLRVDLHVVEPARRPGLGPRRAEDLLRVLQGPEREALLLRGQGLVGHAEAAHREGVEVGDDGLHGVRRVGHEEPVRVHGVVLVVLEEHDVGLRGVPHGVEVHLHEGRVRGPARLPAEDRGDVLPHDVRLPQQHLRHAHPVDGGHVVVEADRYRELDLEVRALLQQYGLQGGQDLVPRVGRAIVDGDARVHGGLLYLRLVRVVADLEEGHETGEETLLRRLPLHVEALPHSSSGKHLCNGVTARGPVNCKPGAAFSLS
mmetsp:Transcript_84234/g.238977  ORF Transcript_84234/g.238977 Transcript_84234/m.238977 type:complete len:442 (-) Transcript_84234:1418-2743(-)